MNDVIVDISGFEGLYGITRSGHIYNLKTGQELHGCVLNGRYNSGYVNMFLFKDGGVKVFPLRKILAMTFLPDYVDGGIIELINPSGELCADNIRMKRDRLGRIIRTRCKVRDRDSGHVYGSLSALSRHLCGDNNLKGTLSVHVHNGTPYKGHIYDML